MRLTRGILPLGFLRAAGIEEGIHLMHVIHKLVLGLLALPAASQAATLVPVTPPPSAVQTIVFGINKHGEITGSWLDSSNVTHGFFGPLNGTYTSFDYGGATTGTVPRALDDDGNIVGFASGPNLYVGTEFLRQADGTIVTIEKNGASLDGVAQGITSKGTESTGDYVTDPNTGVRTGYLASDGVYQTDVTLQLDELTTNPRGINSAGTLAGFYRAQNDVTMRGFIFKKGIVEVINADDSGTTSLEGINKKELASGQVLDNEGNPHSFVFNNKTGLFTSINIQDGSNEQQAWGINDKAQVAVTTGIGASYIYCVNDHQCPRGGHKITEGRSWKIDPNSASHAGTGVKQHSGVLR
jgi:hypothetical protein